MHISKLSIRNFRNFRNGSLHFEKGINTILGENGSGKTNLFYALRLLIDENLPRAIKFYENDFNRTLTQWHGHWIMIQLEFRELGIDEEAQAIAMHKIGQMDEFEKDIGTFSLYFRPKEPKRRELYNYSLNRNKNAKGLAKILENISINDYEITLRGRGNLDFSDDNNYNKYVGDFEQIYFPDPDEERYDVYGERITGFSIPNEISCTYAKALRDVEKDLKSYRDNPLLNLLRGKEKNITVEKKDSIESKIKDLNKEISELDEVKEISSGISTSIRESVGETYAPNISIESELPSEMENLLQSLNLLVGDPDENDYKGKIRELSLGGANLIYLSLKLLEYEKVKVQNKIANFLLIEEPEAHIHTHIQKTLFQKLSEQNTQIIISTHSTHISSVSQISSVNVLCRSNKEALVFHPSKNLSTNQITRIERYLDAVRTNLLFAKGVILVEGDTEQILIPELVKKIFGVSLDELGVSLINIGSTGFDNIAILFDDERIKKKCAILTDLDTSILPLPTIEKNDTPEQHKYRNSQKSGIRRKLKWDELYRKNNFIKVFYANYTFEVDFLEAENSHEVCEAIKNEYKKKSDYEEIVKLINNNNIGISGKEILRLATKFGKGWFALLLAEKISHLTFIPNYILEAISHSSPHISESCLVIIGKYRLSKLIHNSLEGDETDYTLILKKFDGAKNAKKALEIYKTSLPEDILSKFIESLNLNV